ncbi:flagellar basal-body MS-ring/collar protein FliF [Aneurinibacillus uraniidurans]|uniref:flagellar basal-body MS-ring/collar protein FliF n=1 Tax=Aneurinibacillus uraniidurans TaxID=2966586 RepID=UPI00234973A4|nr:flagellar basal-body MS-ring/collar protein FliF [Aneurinibacillus sp. B1]WCN39091.1 flagellar basal-body MS-ring/collar protein FliF [Aneurinibacillus sp. B1]
MNERIQQMQEKIAVFLNRFTRKQKVIAGAIAAFLLISAALGIYIASRPTYVPLFGGNLTESDVAQIKQELDTMGYAGKYQLNGTSVLVPEKDKYTLAADLTAKGVPKGEGVRLDVFSQNIGMGMTDRQFSVVERNAMQTQLADLLKTIDGVKDASVILTMPQESVFVRPNEDTQKATATILVTVEPGRELTQPQIDGLYNLVSKSVPNLPKENIVITDQSSRVLEASNGEDSQYGLDQYDKQRKIKKDIENDIQRNVQNLLGGILGQNKVIVYPYVKLNFDKTQAEEKLVEPVDKDNNEGIVISSEKIQDTSSGKGTQASGTTGTGQSQIPGYPGAGNSGGAENQHEHTEDRVNREVNRITKNIVSQPYKIEDISISVAIDKQKPDPNETDKQKAVTDAAAKDTATSTYVQKVVANVVRTSLAAQGTVVPQNQINQRVNVYTQAFNNDSQPDDKWKQWLIYGGIGLGVLAVIVAFILLRRRGNRSTEEFQAAPAPGAFEVPDLEYADNAEEALVRKQLEKLAGQRPEEFVGLLRSWLADE